MQEAVPEINQELLLLFRTTPFCFWPGAGGGVGVGSDGRLAVNEQVLSEDGPGCIFVNRRVACIFLIGWESISVPLAVMWHVVTWGANVWRTKF